jgi:serine/threonine protein kinase
MTPNTKLDGQADVYALGVILYELFAGRAPFAEIPEPLALMMSKLVDELPPLAPRAPDAPPEIVALTMSMLERDPRQRPTMAEVKARLGEFLRVPAARRSGFLPEVTPPEKLADKLADKRADPDPELPPTESGPLLSAAAKLQPTAEAGAGDAPIAKPPLAVTSGTIIPPTPPEYSSGQLSKPAVSLSQQPTQQRWVSSRIRRGIFALIGASLIVTATIIVWPRLARRAPITTSTVPSPTAAASQRAAAPLGSVRAEPPPTPPTAAVRAEPPAAVPEAVEKPPATPPKVVANDPKPAPAPAPTPARRPSKPRCTPAPLSASCISSGSLSLSRKHVIIQELARLNVRLCSGELLHLRHRPGRIDVLDAPSGLSDSKREQISYSLLGVLGQETQRLGDIYIRCAAP